MPWLSDDYIYRRLITVSVPEDLPSGHPITFSLPSNVYAQGKLREDYEGIEIVKDSDNSAMNRTVTLQQNGSLKIEFVPTTEISNGDQSYYLYYGNLDLIDQPTRDDTSIVTYPVTHPYNDGLISYQKPGEDWVDGVSSVEGSRASFTGYFEDMLVTFISGPDKGIAEIQMLGDELWTPVDTFSTTTGTKTHAITGDGSFNLDNLKIRVSGRSNLSSSDIKVQLSSLSVSKPHYCELDYEEVNLDAL